MLGCTGSALGRAEPAFQSPESSKALAGDKNILWSCEFRIFGLELLGRNRFTVTFGTKSAPKNNEIYPKHKR